jgi:VIT1/CCC1 family predicted Fe2+/Mn2+ transporter
LIVVPLVSSDMLVPAVGLVSVICLGLLGGLGARAGGAPMGPSVLRVAFWGVLAMVVTAAVGKAFGAVVA